MLRIHIRSCSSKGILTDRRHDSPTFSLSDIIEPAGISGLLLGNIPRLSANQWIRLNYNANGVAGQDGYDVVPEPGSLGLLLFGLCGAAWFRARRARRAEGYFLYVSISACLSMASDSRGNTRLIFVHPACRPRTTYGDEPFATDATGIYWSEYSLDADVPASTSPALED
jgi:hypothetical protein